MVYQNKSQPFYKGNQFLPKAGILKEITPQQVIEVEKCIKDPIYFAENYFKIVHQDAEDGLIPLKLYPYQKVAVEQFAKTNRLLMATARQVGKTTIATVLILWIALFNKRKNIALLADKEATAIEILERIQIAYEHLPDWLKGGVREWNKKSVKFENGSKIFASATSGNAARGKSLFFLYIDEAAHVENWEEFAAAVLPTVSASKNSKIVLTSTPFGLNHFYNYYIAAKNKTSEYPLVEVPWWEVEGRDHAWKQKTLADMNYDLQKFAQEQEVEFLGSSGTLINGATLKILDNKIIDPINSSDNGLKMYKRMVKDHQYLLIADTSRGKGLDYSAFHVIDLSTKPFEQVCTFRNNQITATDYAVIIDQIGKYYNYAQLLVELNDNGSAVIDLLFEIHQYENILMTESKGAGKQVSSGYGRSNVDRGIRTNKLVKSSGCAMIKSIIEQDQLLIYDKQTVEELKTFSAKSKDYQTQPTTYQAEQGKHDDLVIGLVLFGWLTNQQFFKTITDTNVLDRLKETDLEHLEDQLLVFGVVNNGLQDQQYDDLGIVGSQLSSTDQWISSSDFDRWMTD